MNPSPQRCKGTPSAITSDAETPTVRELAGRSPTSFDRRAMTNEVIQGGERDAYAALLRPTSWEQGIAYGARVLGRRSRAT